jgi:hypothetical protein
MKTNLTTHKQSGRKMDLANTHLKKFKLAKKSIQNESLS